MLKLRRKGRLQTEEAADALAELQSPIKDHQPLSGERAEAIAPDEAARMAPAGFCFDADEPETVPNG